MSALLSPGIVSNGLAEQTLAAEGAVVGAVAGYAAGRAITNVYNSMGGNWYNPFTTHPAAAQPVEEAESTPRLA